MVLKTVGTLLAVLFYVSPVMAKPRVSARKAKEAPVSDFGQAAQAYKEQDYTKCLDAFSRVATDQIGVKELNLKAHCELGAKKYDEAQTTARTYLAAKYSWWKDFEAKKDSTKSLKSLDKAELHLVWIMGATNAQKYQDAPHERVTREMKLLKGEVEKIYQALLEVDFEGEKAELLNAPIQAKEESFKKQRQSHGLYGALLYSRFSTRFDFDSPGINGKGLGSLLGIHVGQSWKNYYRQFGWGLKAGLLHSNYQDQSSGQYSSNGKGYFWGGSFQYLKHLHESGSAIGLEINVMGLQMSTDIPSAGPIKALNMEIIPTIVYRAGFYSLLYLDFKYGRPLREGTGIWTIELGRAF